MLKLLNDNKEPICQSIWRRSPYDVRPYRVAIDGGELIDFQNFEPTLVPTHAKTACDSINSSRNDVNTSNQSLCNDDIQSPANTKITKVVDLTEDGDDDKINKMQNYVLDCFSKHKGIIYLKNLPNPLMLGEDLEERSAWGLDCFAYRALHDALSLCSAFCESDDIDKLEKNTSIAKFINGVLIAAVQMFTVDGWNIHLALKQIINDSEPGSINALAAEHLQWLIPCVEAEAIGYSNKLDGNLIDINPADYLYFRIHPKGVGVFTKQTIKAGAYIQQYLGELYTPWRWFEKQDQLRRQNPDQELPDFYNISLERPADLSGGRDIMYVEFKRMQACNAGNYASRLSHSCEPNCRNVNVVLEGSPQKVTNAIFAVRDIQVGTELCWDYACVTESEKEFRSAVCLCSTPKCRGSFLYYVDSTTYQEILHCHHDFLHRNVILLQAVSQPLNKEDSARLARNGIDNLVLGLNPPTWLKKFASLILEFIEFEVKYLPIALASNLKYKNQVLEIEAVGIRENRIQNLIITIHKIRYVLRNQPDKLKLEPPLRFLSDDEIINMLWCGESSIWLKARTSILKDCIELKVSDVEKLHSLAPPKTVEEACNRLLNASEIFRSLGSCGVAMADILYMYAKTSHYFTSTKYECIRSKAVSTVNEACSTDLKAKPAPTVASAVQSGVNKKGRAPKPSSPCYDTKVYRPSYIWGQCCVWYKQSVYDPTASLSADRRGVLNLPDPESLFKKVNGHQYVSRQRKTLLNNIKNTPASMWSSSLPFSYKNSNKVFGSFMLDAVLRNFDYCFYKNGADKLDHLTKVENDKIATPASALNEDQKTVEVHKHRAFNKSKIEHNTLGLNSTLATGNWSCSRDLKLFDPIVLKIINDLEAFQN